MTCRSCPLHVACQHPCVWGVGPSPCPLMLIGEAPGFNEDLEGKPFVGPAGKLLDFILNKLGLRRDQIYITNLIKCRPERNELPKGKELESIVESCKKHLHSELSTVHPKVVVLLGGTSLLYLAHERFISRVEGSTVRLLMSGRRKIQAVAAFHPAYVLRSPGKEPNLARVLALAARRAGMKIHPEGYEKTGVFEYELRT